MFSFREFVERVISEIAAEGLVSFLCGGAVVIMLGSIIEFIFERSPLEIIGLGFLLLLLWLYVMWIASKLSAWRRHRAKEPVAHEPDSKDVAIEFRESKQGASEPDQSWLHIRVAAIQGPRLERASIKCRITQREGSAFTGNAAYGLAEQLDEIRDMRWQSMDDQRGESSTTIETGRPKFSPIILRREPNNENKAPFCVLTDQQYLMRHEERTWLKLGQGLYEIIFTVKAQDREWNSPVYVLQIPGNEDSNGQFLLEKHYADET